MTIPIQIYLTKLAEKYNISINDIEELWFYREAGMTTAYQTKLKEIKQ